MNLNLKSVILEMLSDLLFRLSMYSIVVAKITNKIHSKKAFEIFRDLKWMDRKVNLSRLII